MKVLVASPVDRDALAALGERHDVVTAIGASEAELAAAAADREVIVFRSGVALSTMVLDSAPMLRLLVRAGSGLDNLDLSTVEARGITLERVPGPGAQAVAELTFGLMLGLARQILVADRAWRQGRWIKSELAGYNLRGKTLGVIGLGSIGSRVAELGQAWSMTAIGCVEHFTEERRDRFAASGVELLQICDDVLARADFVTIHVPLTGETRNLIGIRELALMKPGAFLVNVARGGIVDEMALRDVLAEGRLRGAALDVHAAEGEGCISPLAELSNVILTPHIGAMTVDAQREIGEIVVRAIDDFAAGSGAGAELVGARTAE